MPPWVTVAGDGLGTRARRCLRSRRLSARGGVETDALHAVEERWSTAGRGRPFLGNTAGSVWMPICRASRKSASHPLRGSSKSRVQTQTPQSNAALYLLAVAESLPDGCQRWSRCASSA